MGLTDRLRDLDQRILPGTRDADEDAESYLRRVAASRAITPAQAGDVMAALRVYFDVQPGETDGQDGEAEGEGEGKSEEAKAEASESDGDDSDGESDSDDKD